MTPHYTFRTTKVFDRQLKKCIKRGLDISKIKIAMKILVEHGSLPESYRPHTLHGKHQNQWECHLSPDWLMIWEQNDNDLTLLFLETGSHSDLFK